jgi:hypothetical protein
LQPPSHPPSTPTERAEGGTYRPVPTVNRAMEILDSNMRARGSAGRSGRRVRRAYSQGSIEGERHGWEDWTVEALLAVRTYTIPLVLVSSPSSPLPPPSCAPLSFLSHFLPRFRPPFVLRLLDIPSILPDRFCVEAAFELSLISPLCLDYRIPSPMLTTF